MAHNLTTHFSWNHKRINFRIIFKVCTYDNWAASVKCAMCQTTNNKKVLTENQHNNRKTATTSSTSDIYKMGATSLSRSTSPQLHGMWLFWPESFLFLLNFWPRPVLLTSDFEYLKGSFNNYVDKILTIIDHLPTFTVIRESMRTIDI